MLIGCSSEKYPKGKWSVEQYVKKLDFFLKDNCIDTPLIIVSEKSDWFVGKMKSGSDDMIINKQTYQVVYAFDESPSSGDVIVNWSFLYEADYTKFWQLIPNPDNKRRHIFYIVRWPEDFVPTEKVIIEEQGHKIIQQCYSGSELCPWPLSDAFLLSADEEGFRETPDVYEPEKAIAAYLILRDRYSKLKSTNQ